jgi:catechol 2,3-dioxygenase-like lactoylglutathione lyase family enzyme
MSQTFARLRIDNYDTAIPFYIDYLGFAIAWEYRENENANVYMGITRGTSPGIQSGTLELHLTEFPGDQPPKTQVMFDVEAVYDLYADLQSRKPDIAEIITDQPWGKSELHLEDPFGNKLIFTGPTPKQITSSPPAV